MKPHKALDFTRINTAVGFAALEDVGLLCTLHNIYTILVFEVTNTGQALADFGLMVQPMHGASFHLMLDGNDSKQILYGHDYKWDKKINKSPVDYYWHSRYAYRYWRRPTDVALRKQGGTMDGCVNGAFYGHERNVRNGAYAG